MSHRPIMLGVVGDSAAGKTTITAGIAKSIGADDATVICVDDYHRYNREQRKTLDITALHPDCNYIDIMEQHLRALAEGEPILKPIYNHATGDFEAPEYVKPKRFVIVEGLLAFHTQRLRDAFHVKVYLDPPEELRRQWKIKRDCTKRGYKESQVLAELEKREQDSAAYIRPQKQWADMVVRFYHDSPTKSEQLGVHITMRPTLPHPDLSGVIGKSSGGQPVVKLSVGHDVGRLTEFLDIDGSLSDQQAGLIEDAIWSQQPALQHLRADESGAFVDGTVSKRSNPLALSQLLIAYHLLLGRLAKDKLADQMQKIAAGST